MQQHATTPRPSAIFAAGELTQRGIVARRDPIVTTSCVDLACWLHRSVIHPLPMIGALDGPWLIAAALLLLAVGVWRERRGTPGEWTLIGALVVGAAIARLVWGLWGPLHINGQAPLWIRGAFEAKALARYGPGYFELFGWMTRLGWAADQAIFTGNALLSALSPALLYAAARLAGARRGGALAAGIALAADPVSIRMAASEGYFSSIIVLVLAAEASLALWLRADLRGDRFAPLALGAACLFAAAAARVHPMAYVPVALTPLIVLGAARPSQWGGRAGRAIVAGMAVAATVLLTSGNAIFTALQSLPFAQHAFGGLRLRDWEFVAAVVVVVLLLRRWSQPRWLPVLGVASLTMLLATEDAFRQHPFWTLCYQRLYLPGILLGAAALFPRRVERAVWSLAAGAAAAAIFLIPAWPHLGRTTEQLEYTFLQEALRSAPPGCALASVGRAGERVWEIPSYLVPSRGAQSAGNQLTVEGPADLAAAANRDCVLYVRSSLCSSLEGRPLCESIEHQTMLERVASRMLPAAPSYLALPYDRPEVEVVVFRRPAPAASSPAAPSVSDGAPITPEFAQALYDSLVPLREADGCRLVHFDTSRFRITAGLEAPGGKQYPFELSTAARGEATRRVRGWGLAVPPDLERDCSATLAAIERVLSGTATPTGVGQQGSSQREGTQFGYDLLALSFVLLLLGTASILYRQTKEHSPPPYAVLALAGVWVVGLVLRLTLSPRNFLHEYYHVAETVAGYLVGEIAPIYGNTGPALFRLMGWIFARPEDTQVIFLTNAVISSLAIPAIALLDLVLMRSWARALCAAALLAVFPQHIRFSAAEDLFVMGLTFGLWALALFALYLRTQRIRDAVVAALAISLAMQSRPELLLLPGLLVALVALVMPSAWRMLFAWRTLVALVFLGWLLVPRFQALFGALAGGPSTPPTIPELAFYLHQLVLLQPEITPPLYWVALGIGFVWTAVRKPGYLGWNLLAFFGYTLFSISLFSNPPYNLRSQILPNAFAILIAAGAASAWMDACGTRHARRAAVVGAAVLGLLCVQVVIGRAGFITELRDQQLQWTFLERTVPGLPDQATLLTAVEVGGHKLDAFPDFLLQRAGKKYQMVDVRRAAKGEVAWPPPGDDLLFYQGMFCHFAAAPGDPLPSPLSDPCTAVHARYLMEPLTIEDLDTEGYSLMPYGPRPFRIGFYRLTGSRQSAP